MPTRSRLDDLRGTPWVRAGRRPRLLGGLGPAPVPASSWPAPAGLAAAEDGEVTDVRFEAIFVVEGGNQRRYRGGGYLGDAAAQRADQVHMLRFGGQVVAGCAVAQVGVRHQAELLQQFQGPVDGGDIDAARGLLDVGPNLLGRGVLQPGDCRQDQLTLGRDTVAAGSQRLVPRLRHGPRLASARGRWDRGPAATAENPLACLGRPDITLRPTRERRWSNRMHGCRTREVAVR